jgi:hypothetical protein
MCRVSRVTGQEGNGGVLMGQEVIVCVCRVVMTIER